MFIGIEAGTLISVGTSLLLVVKHTTTSRLALLGKTTVLDQQTGQPKAKFRSLHEDGRAERIEGCLVIKLEESLFFGNCGQLKDRLKRIEVYGDLRVHPSERPAPRIENAPPSEIQSSCRILVEPNLKSIIFEMSAVSSIDGSATQTLLEIVKQYHSRQIAVSFVKLRDKCKIHFERSGITKLSFFFPKVRDALNYVHKENFDLFENEADAESPTTSKSNKPPFRKIRKIGEHSEVVELVSDSDFDF